MSSSFLDLHYHLVFATKHRQGWISEDWRPALHAYLGGTIRGLGGSALSVGGVEDHVHLLVRLKSTHAVADIVRETKKASTAWVKENTRASSFRWQEGCAALTVSASARAGITAYIERQEEHHRTVSFRDELRGLLEECGIPFDESWLE